MIVAVPAIVHTPAGEASASPLTTAFSPTVRSPSFCSVVVPPITASLPTVRCPTLFSVTGPLPFGDVGLLYACMPGLLNVLAMLDVYGWSERRWLGAEVPAAAELQGEVPA